MMRISSIFLLCSSIYAASPIPLPAEVPAASPSPIPSPLPIVPAPRPLGQGLNNPYYNNVGAPIVPILTYSSEHGLDGKYAFSFTTADGKQAEESGYLKDAFVDNAGNPQGTQVVRGSYSYISPDGTPVEVSYVADEYGFRPTRIYIPYRKDLNPALDKDSRQFFNPSLNPYNNYLYGNRYLGQYNNGYDPTRFNPYYNNYKPFPSVSQTTVKPETKKDE